MKMIDLYIIHVSYLKLIRTCIVMIIFGFLLVSGGVAAQPPAQKDVVASVIQQLKAGGWREDVAAKVAELNKSLLSIQAEVNPDQFKETVRLLVKLGSLPAVQRTISKRPETAGLLAGSSQPEVLAKTIEYAGSDYNWVANLYMQHAERKDSDQLATALASSRTVICKLAKMGIIGSENLFMFPRNGEGANVYERWLNDHLDLLSSSTEETILWVDLINRHGGKLLAKLNEDQDFRIGFERTYWPMFLRIVKSATVNRQKIKVAAESACIVDESALYFSEPNIWNVLMIKNQPEKIIQYAGLMGPKLIFGDPFLKIDPYPENVRNKVVELIVDQHEKSLRALSDSFCLKDIRFHTILRKKVETETLANVLLEISNAGSGNMAQVINKYFNLGEEGIKRVQAGQPEGLVTWIPLYYTLYKVPVDYYYGVEPTTMDFLQATADPLLIVFTAGGGKLFFAGSKEAAKKIAKEATEKGIQNFAVTTLKDQGLKVAAKKVAMQGVERAIERGMMSEKGTIYRGMQSMMANTSEMIILVLKGDLKFPAIEITYPLQYAFRNSGIGRMTWKRITGLEARLFMRGDARIYVRLNNTTNALLGPRLAPLFNVAVQDLRLGAVIESEPVKKAAEAGVKQIAMGGAEANGLWQRNASQWWLLNATEPLNPAFLAK